MPGSVGTVLHITVRILHILLSTFLKHQIFFLHNLHFYACTNFHFPCKITTWWRFEMMKQLMHMSTYNDCFTKIQYFLTWLVLFCSKLGTGESNHLHWTRTGLPLSVSCSILVLDAETRKMNFF